MFADVKHFLATGEHLPEPDMAERVAAARTHLERAVQWKGERLGVLETRKHYAGYFRGVPDFKQMRIKLCTADTSEEVFEILNNILDDF